MRRFLIYTILLVLSVVATAQTTSLERWDAGNKAYVEGDYAKAIEEYQAIVNGGEYSLTLYYNLANAYFKSGNVGKSILYYHKALRLDPSQEDVLHNLAIAEAQTKDKVAEESEFVVGRWWRAVRNSLGCTVWSVLSLTMFGLLLVFAIIFLLAERIGVRKAGFYGALCSILLFVLTTAFAISSRNDMLTHDEAIVLSSAISVKSSPDRAATDLFVLHEGAKVRIVSDMEEWYEVSLADGKKGWTEKKHVELI